MKNRPIIGILGGIGAGKSTVAVMLRRLGCAVIDADRIAGEILDSPKISEKLREHFGRGIYTSEGTINREKLAEIVFQKQTKLDLLNSITHPPILALCEEKLRVYLQDPSVKGVVLDMPLLLEVGWEIRCDALIFVECREDLRARRASKKGIGDEKNQKKRENFQISLDRKKRIAHYIVRNNSDESDLEKQVEIAFSAIRDRL